jgi:hypothetical protein
MANTGLNAAIASLLMEAHVSVSALGTWCPSVVSCATSPLLLGNLLAVIIIGRPLYHHCIGTAAKAHEQYNRTGETILHLFLQLKHQRILICAGVRPIYSEAPTTLLHFRAGSASTTKVTLTMKFNVVSRRHSGPESLERQLTTSLKQQRQSPSIFVDRTH